MQKIKHFSHRTNLKCTGSQETALHELGKKILVDNTQIVLPKKIGRVIYSSPVAEKRLETKRPDVSAKFDGQPIFFEIFVSHEVDKGKEKFFIDKKHKSVEIDLSGCKTSTLEEIKNIVLNETTKKKVFYWQDESSLVPQPTENNNNDWILKGVLGVIGFFILRAIFLSLFKPTRV